MTITLPKTPDGYQFEDFVTASLRALGYFVETRVTLREGKKDVLELDVVASPSGSDASKRELYEAKKPAPTFPNLFKLYGQRVYLGIERACLVTLNDADDWTRPVYEAKGAELGVRPFCHPVGFDQLEDLAAPCNGLTAGQRSSVAITAWYLEIAKRVARGQLAQECRDHKGVLLYQQVRQYGFECSSSFFGKTPLDRAEILYAAYFDNPKLTGQLVTLLSGGSDETATWRRLADTSGLVWLQSQMLLEGASRIAILKHALDHVESTGGAELPTLELKIGSKLFAVQTHALPQRFVAGLKTLHSHPHSLRLPFLFQTFLELCGGFIYQDDADDLAMLSAIAGIPADEVVPALRLLDEFFAPTDGSMFYTIKDQLLCLKLVPAFIRGVGCLLRQKYFSLNDYSEKYTDLGWLMSKWHDVQYRVLCEELPEVTA